MSVLKDGFQTLITFAAAPTVKLYEKTVTPPGIDGGGEIDVTTMLNDLFRTRAPKALLTVDNAESEAAYDPAVYEDIIDLINVNNLITVTFPDGSTVAFYGWLNKFKPNANKEGEQPTAACEIIASNLNASGVETGPVYTAPH